MRERNVRGCAREVSPSCSGTCRSELSKARVRWDVRGADRPSACPEIAQVRLTRARSWLDKGASHRCLLRDLLMMTVSATATALTALTPTAAEAFASALRINAKTR